MNKVNRLKRFTKDDRGSVLIMTGLFMLVLLAIGGAGFDLGRQQIVRIKIQQAADAAALAAGSIPYTGSSNDTADRTATAQRYFDLNYPETFLNIKRPTPTITVDPGNTVIVEANVPKIPTVFVRFVGYKNMAAGGASTVLVKKESNEVDILLVMDNSGSMGEWKDVGKTNSLNAIPNIRPICINGWINYYTSLGFNLTNGEANNKCNQYEGAKGFTRLNALRYNADKFTDDLFNATGTDIRIALVTWDAIVIDKLDFTKDKKSVKDLLMRMYGRGSTDSTSGLKQAELYATNFRNNASRVIIFMSDGANYPFQDSYNKSSLKICDSLKSMKNTQLFSIAFGNKIFGKEPENVMARQFLSDCATGPNGSANPGPAPNEGVHYFSAPDAAKLDAAFQAILVKLQKVRIIE